MSVRERERDCFRQPVVQFQCSIKNLQDLMQTRGVDAVVKLQQEFGGVVELCRRLYTSPTEGQTHCSSLVLWLVTSGMGDRLLAGKPSR